MRRLLPVALLAAMTAALTACGGGEADQASPPRTASAPAAGSPQDASRKTDARDGGFEVALGEWAVTPEAEAIRPGAPSS